MIERISIILQGAGLRRADSDFLLLLVQARQDAPAFLLDVGLVQQVGNRVPAQRPLFSPYVEYSLQ